MLRDSVEIYAEAFESARCIEIDAIAELVEWMRGQWHRAAGGIKDAPGLVFGLLLVIVMVFMPQGLWGMARRFARRRSR